MYIWQAENWPNFSYQWQALQDALEKLDTLQAQLLQRVAVLNAMEKAELEQQQLVQRIQASLALEDEAIDSKTLATAAAHQLGLNGMGKSKATPRANQLVQAFSAATHQLTMPLSHSLLNRWHHPLVQGHQLGDDVDLRGAATLQLVQVTNGKPQVFYQAPPRDGLEQALADYYSYYNQPITKQGHGFIKAAISYLWLVTLHPFEGGNTPLALLLVDRLLARINPQSCRFYNLASVLEQQQAIYYTALQKTQKSQSASQQLGGPMDITHWLIHFFGWLAEAMQATLQGFERIAQKQRFWQRHAQTILTQRQINVLNHLLLHQQEESWQQINATRYMQLTEISKATATRDLADLMKKGCLKKGKSGGRSTVYHLQVG